MSKRKQTKENKHGYVQNLSPVKKANKTKTDWFDFDFQVSEDEVKRVVGFDQSKHGKIKYLQDTKTPVILKNVILQENEKDDWFFNQQSYAFACPNSDIPFPYNKQEPKSSKVGETQQATDETVNELLQMRGNQKINVHGTLSMGDKDPQEIEVSTSQTSAANAKEKLKLKEDCFIEDGTGVIEVHIWEPLIEKLESGKAYYLKNMTLRYFKGTKFLSTNKATTYVEETSTLEKLVAPGMLKNPEKEILVKEFKYISKVTIFKACRVCNRRVEDQSSGSVKCQGCSTRQRVADLKNEGSAKVCIQHDESELWLTVFTKSMESLLKKTKSETMTSTVEQIEESLMELKNITIKYNSARGVLVELLNK